MQDKQNQIHSTAIIGDNVKIGTGNKFGPYVNISGNVDIGDNNHFEQGVIVVNNVRIGNDNKISAYVCIGHLGEMGHKGERFLEDGIVTISNHCTIREYVNIHSPVRTNETFIDDHVYIMNKCYIAHDVRIGAYSALTAGVKLAGRATLGAHVNMGMGSTVHQRINVGDGAMVGMNAAIVSHIAPYCKVAGVPARILGFNRKTAEKNYEDIEIVNEVGQNFESILNQGFKSDNTLAKLIHDFLAENADTLNKYKI